MVNVSFNLRDRNVNKKEIEPTTPNKAKVLKETPIVMMANYSNSQGKLRLKYPTRLKIVPKDWKTTKKRAKATNEYRSLNKQLDELEAAAKRVFRDLQSEGTIPTPNDYREALDIALGRKNKEEKKIVTVESFIVDYIEENLTRKSKNTIKTYNTTLRQFRAYQSNEKQTYLFENLDKSFFEGFRDYLAGKTYATNYIAKTFSILRHFIKEADDLEDVDLKVNPAYLKKYAKIKSVEVDSIYLTPEDLATIFNYDFSKNKGLEFVRDLYLLQCYSGLRYSDLHKYDANKIKVIEGNDMIPVQTQKGKIEVWIPLHPVSKKIITKYTDTNGVVQLPRVYANGVFNRYLKDIGKAVGFYNIIDIKKERAFKQEIVKYEKWELITTHTARRTLVTNLLDMGIDPRTIGAITGHKKLATIQKYDKQKTAKKAGKVYDNPFFQG